MNPEQYTPENAEKEAAEIKKRVNSGEAQSYEQAERQIEREKIVEERGDEGEIKRAIRKTKEFLKTPEGIIGERDMALFKSVDLSSQEIKWIASVKKASEDFKGLNSQKKLSGRLPKRMAVPNAYDLVRVHAMLLKDLKEFGPDMISDKTEQYLDEILLDFMGSFSVRSGLFKMARGEQPLPPYSEYSRFESELVGIVRDYINVKDTKSKAMILTRILNLIHTGGSRVGLDHYLAGYPIDKNVRSLRDFFRSRDEFLSKLNNLGRKPG